MIQIENLSYEYPGVKAIDNVSLQIPKGTITALVGPNGSGKTTLLENMAGLKKPFSGTILVGGIDIIADPRGGHKLIGHLADVFGLYDSLSVYQALQFHAMSRRVSPQLIHERITEVVVKLNLSDKMQQRVGSLSRGMRQRLAIGQALIHKPEILLLDEPASGLDPEARHSLAKLFIELNKAGMTLVVSSHILAELDEYANNLLIMREGKVVDADWKDINTHSQKLILEFVDQPENIDQLLANFEFIDKIDAQQNQVICEFNGTEDQQAELIAAMVGAAYKLKSCYIRKSSLEEQYLERIR